MALHNDEIREQLIMAVILLFSGFFYSYLLNNDLKSKCFTCVCIFTTSDKLVRVSTNVDCKLLYGYFTNAILTVNLSLLTEQLFRIPLTEMLQYGTVSSSTT